jgi:outer membrane biosynthesis protein TonB
VPRIRFDPVLIQAVIAGALSFAHLHDIAEAAGQHGWKAWAYPISVDLLLVAAWRRMRTLRTTDQPAGAAWAWFVIALTASLGANIATAGLLDLHQTPAWLRILVAGWPALAFLGGSLLAHQPTPAPDRAPVPETAPAAVPVPDLERVPEPVTVPDQEPAPALPPAPVPSASAVPAALIDHARKLADDYRTRTGIPIDTDTLRTRLGVPPALAAAIAAQLT